MCGVLNREREKDGREDDCDIAYDEECGADLVQCTRYKGSGAGKVISRLDPTDDAQDEADYNHQFDEFKHSVGNEGAVCPIDVVDQTG